MNAKILVSPLVILFLLSGGMAWAEAEEDHPKRVSRTVERQGDQESKVREVSRRVTRVQENRREDHGPRGERDQMRGPRGQDPRGPMRPMAGRAQSARQHRGIPGREQGAWGRGMQGARGPGRGMWSHVSGRRSGTHPWAQQMRMRTVMQQRGARGASASRPAWQIIAYRNGWRPSPTASQGRPSARGPQRATRGPRRPGPDSRADRTPPHMHQGGLWRAYTRSMEITPRELRDVEIAEAFRGYHRDVVNDHHIFEGWDARPGTAYRSC